MTTSEDERSEVRAAIDRLISGQSKRSTGALSIMQLAEEAGVKRWVLTHKHTDLADDFRRKILTTVENPTALGAVQKRAAAAEAANQRLRAENADLREQMRTYAQVIHELTIERSRVESAAVIRLESKGGGRIRRSAQR